MKIKIAIPSYKRAEQIASLTLKLIDTEIFDVYVFVRQEETYTYQEHCPDATVVWTDAIGITPTRNAILDYFQEGDKVLMLDDDIKSVKFLFKDKLQKLNKEQITKLIIREFDKCEKQGLKMWWIYPIANNFFMSSKYNTKCFIIWTFAGIINTELRFDETLTLKEDYDYSLQHIFTYGWVLRNNSVAVEAIHYTNKWWCVDYRDKNREQIAINILKKKWWTIIRDNSKRENEILLNLK